MSTYTFTYTPDFKDGVKVVVEYDDTENPFIEEIFSTFEQFLLGVTYQPDSIEKYLDTKKLHEVRLDFAIRVEELKRDMAALKHARVYAGCLGGLE